MHDTSILDLIEDAAGKPRILTRTGPLDVACRGGIPLGSRVVIGGAPGAGKTTLASQWALALAEQGAHVVILATDEGASGIAVRMGQQGAGLPREALESGEPATMRALASYLASVKGGLRLLADTTIERAIEGLPNDGPRVLIVDSLQTARSSRPSGTGKRASVESAVAAIKTAALSGILTISTSELAREAYKGGKRKSALGSYKGSGDIEYDIDLGLALTCDAAGKEITCAIEKSRIGERITFPLYRDKVRALLLSEAPTVRRARTWQDVVKAPTIGRRMPCLPTYQHAGTITATAYVIGLLAGVLSWKC